MTTIPGRPESLIAYVNLDVVGCCGVGMGASEESPTLFARAKRAAEAEGIGLSPSRGSSDQASFVRRRVEVVHLLWSETGAIHTLRDTADKTSATSLDAVGETVADLLLHWTS